MKKRFWLILLIFNYSLFGCSDKTAFYIKNSSFTNQKIWATVSVDGNVIMSDTLKYDNSEYGHIMLQRKLESGNHVIEINLPDKAIKKTENIKMVSERKFIYITITDNTSAIDYHNGDLKINISLNKKQLP